MIEQMKLTLPLYKIIVAVVFTGLYSVIRGIAYVNEIPLVIDAGMAILAIIFFSDIYLLERKGQCVDLFRMCSRKKKIQVFVERFFINIAFLMIITFILFFLFYVLQQPALHHDEKVTGFFFDSLLIALFSIIGFGMISAALSDLLLNQWGGISCSVMIWILLHSIFAAKMPKELQFFSYEKDGLWLTGKLNGLIFASCIFMISIWILTKRQDL